MNYVVKFWIENLYKSAIEETKGRIKNEHIWELSYNGESPNPHTQNIKDMEEYIDFLEKELSNFSVST